jgi:hypothetical protein
MVPMSKLGVRWTIGDVSARGFEALRFSIWGAWKLFGPQAAYVICYNSLPLDQGRALTGPVPEGIGWHDASHDLPAFLQAHMDPGLAEGAGWKFAPLRSFPNRYELALDNDCILWALPAAMAQWLTEGDPRTCVVAEDVVALYGQWADRCGPEPRNGGLRGLPPGFDLEAALRTILAARPIRLTSELDEQGLQMAALAPLVPRVVTVEEVTICSPFPPHLPYLERCGAHFCGVNVKALPWSLAGRPATAYIHEHWLRLREAVATYVAASSMC